MSIRPNEHCSADSGNASSTSALAECVECISTTIFCFKLIKCITSSLARSLFSLFFLLASYSLLTLLACALTLLTCVRFLRLRALDHLHLFARFIACSGTSRLLWLSLTRLLRRCYRLLTLALTLAAHLLVRSLLPIARAESGEAQSGAHIPVTQTLTHSHTHRSLSLTLSLSLSHSRTVTSKRIAALQRYAADDTCPHPIRQLTRSRHSQTLWRDITLATGGGSFAERR